jgi:ABC-type uncharacterized transport system substrate-binding protein
MLGIRRREFITLIGGVAAVWPVGARAQEPAMPVIGFMSGASAAPWAHLVAAFHEGLKVIGFVEGQNVDIDFHWADGQYDRLPTIAAELVRRKVAVIVAVGSPAVLPAVAATPTIPIVFITGGDPIKLGIVRSLNRPAGNATGVYLFAADIEAKRLGLLRDLVPTSALIGVLLNPNNANAETQSKDVQEAARATSIPVVFSVAADPVQLGLVSSLNRPGGNLTGINGFAGEVGAKALALLHELVPSIATIGFLENQNNPIFELTTRDVLAAASVVGLRVQILKAGTDREIDAAFVSMV